MLNPLGNRFLVGLNGADKARLFPQLKPLELDLAAELQEQGERVTHVLFPLKGLISLLTAMEDGRTVEAATVGPTSALGLAVGMEIPRSTSRAVVKASGFALSVSAAQFLKVTRASAALPALIFEHHEMLLRHVQQTAACNCFHTAEKRLASWLLQAQDHCAGDEVIPFTQEFLSNMLGLRRSTVNEVASAFQASGLIRYSRGKITVLNRRRLEDTACECYGVISRLGGRAGRAKRIPSSAGSAPV